MDSCVVGTLEAAGSWTKSWLRLVRSAVGDQGELSGDGDRRILEPDDGSAARTRGGNWRQTQPSTEARWDAEEEGIRRG